MFTRQVCDWFLSNLAKLPGNYLEIGVYGGDSLRELADANPSKLIIGVDPFIEDGCTTHNSGVEEGSQLLLQKEQTYSNIKDVSNILFFEQTSENFYTNTPTEQFYISAVFVDGSHHYTDVSIDCRLAIALLSERGGVVCFDDLHVPDVGRAVNEFLQNNKDRVLHTIDIVGGSSCVFVIDGSDMSELIKDALIHNKPLTTDTTQLN